MRKYLWGFLFFASLLGAVDWKGTEQEGVQLQVFLDKEELGIDETITLRLTGTFPEGVDLDLPALKQRMLQGASLIVDQWDLIEEKELENGIEWRLDPLLEGTYALNLLTVPLMRGEEDFNYIGKVFPIRVLPRGEVSIDLKELAYSLLPFQKEYPLSVSRENRQKWAVSDSALEKKGSFNRQKQQEKTFPLMKTALFLTLFFALYLFCKNYDLLLDKTKEWLNPPADPKTRAIRQIEAIARKRKENFELGIVEISDSLRNYVENVYQIRASKLTTPEFLALARKSAEIDDKAKENLKEFLETGDLVKFAKKSPSQDTFEEALSFAKGFVETRV